MLGLDIYAGTLTRYYSHNWKAVVQQWADDYGVELEIEIGGRQVRTVASRASEYND